MVLLPAGCINYCLLVDFKYLVNNAYIVTHKKRFLSECFVFLKLTAGMLLSVVFKLPIMVGMKGLSSISYTFQS